MSARYIKEFSVHGYKFLLRATLSKESTMITLSHLGHANYELTKYVTSEYLEEEIAALENEALLWSIKRGGMGRSKENSIKNAKEKLRALKFFNEK